MTSLVNPFVFFTSMHFLFALTLTLVAKSIAIPSNFPQIVLHGDADLAADGSRVVLTRSGLLLLRGPFVFLNPKPTSFSTDFTFSVAGDNAGGISLVMIPEDLASKLSARTTIRISPENGFLVIANVSSAESKLVVKSRSWIDYDPSSKRLEVRVAKLEESRPSDPITAFSVDFPAIWGDRQVLIGLTSTTSDLQSVTIYSWSFKRTIFPKWSHSMPVNPRAGNHEKPRDQRKSFCWLAIIGGSIFVIMIFWGVAAIRHTKAKQAVNSSRYEIIGVKN